MEAKQFDSVARAVGQGTARRRLLAGLLGAVLAGSLGRATGSAKGKRPHHRRHGVTAQAGAQDCKRTLKPCKRNSQCCSDNCVGASGQSTAKSGGTCQPVFQGTCAGGEADFCLTHSGTCNPDPSGPQCACFPTAAGGATVCVTVNSLTCAILDCTSNDDCATLGAGYVCIRAGTDPATCGCPTGTTNRNFCSRQCNVQPASTA